MSDLYEAQRAMRAMRRAAIQRGVVAILDVGTSKVACLILRFDGRDRVAEGEGIGAMAGQTQFRVIGAATTRSRGIELGETCAVQETERAIRTAVQSAQKMANTRVDHVIACLSGGQPRSYGLAGIVNLDSDVVTETDVARVLASCEVPDYGTDREVLHAQPVNFALDHRAGLIDPRNLRPGTRRPGEFGLCLGDRGAGRGRAGTGRGLHRHGRRDDRHVDLHEEAHDLCRRCAAGRGSRQPGYLEGVAGLDGGRGTDQDVPRRRGGETGDWEHDRRRVSRAELIGIIRPRIEEILEEVRQRLDAAGFEHLPSQQIVLTGGASQIPGLDILAPKILGQQVRVGRPLRVHGLPQAATGSAFAGAVGLALFAAHPQDEWWDFEMPSELGAPRSLKRAVKWFRDNW